MEGVMQTGSKHTVELNSVNTQLLDDKRCRMGLNNLLDRGKNPKEQLPPTKDCRISSFGPLYCQRDSKSFPHQSKSYMWNESHLLITEQYSPFSGARSSSWHGMRPIFQPCCGSHRASHHCSPLLLQVDSFALLFTGFVSGSKWQRMEESLGVFNHCQAPHCHLDLFGNSQEQALYITNPFFLFFFLFF